MDVLTGIRDSYLTNGLSDDQIRKVADICEEVTFSDLQEVVREEETADDIYLILRGHARVTTSHGDPIARLGQGAILGEIALFESCSRSATVVSDGESSMARIQASKFNALIEQEPQIGVTVLRNVGRTLCQRLRSSNVQLEAVLSAL